LGTVRALFRRSVALVALVALVAAVVPTPRPVGAQGARGRYIIVLTRDVTRPGAVGGHVSPDGSRLFPGPALRPEA